MAGELWLDAKRHRLVSINGQLVNEVKFAGGLLGHLEKGGQLAVKQVELIPGYWQVSEEVHNYPMSNSGYRTADESGMP